MTAPNDDQKTNGFNLVLGAGATQSVGAFLGGTLPVNDHPLAKAILQSESEMGYPQGAGIDLFAGYQMLKILQPNVTPDSSSNDELLRFVGRTIEIYQEQNP